MRLIALIFALVAFPLAGQAQYAHRSNPGLVTSAGATITAVGSGNCPTGGGCVTLNTQGTTTLTALITGTWSQTLQFACSNDGWTTVTPIAADTFANGSMSGAPATTTTANGTFIMPTFGFRECGLYATVWTSNTSQAIRLDADPSPAVPIGATGAAALQLQGTTPDGSALLGNPLSEGIGFNGVNRVPRYCDKVAQISTTIAAAASAVQIIAAVGAQNIYVCGYQLGISTGTTGTAITWVEGTGAACVTGQTTVMNPVLTTPITAPTTPNMTFGVINPAPPFIGVAGDALCLKQAVTTNTTTITGWLSYTQN